MQTYSGEKVLETAGNKLQKWLPALHGFTNAPRYATPFKQGLVYRRP
jgi:hypothetical protein